MDFINLFITFSGRINRAKFWIAVLVFTAINIVMAGLVYATDGSTPAQIVNGLVSLAVFISGIGVGIKRLHDRNKSGWYLLLFYLAPSVLFTAGYILGMTEGGETIGGVLAFLSLAIMVWAFVELGCLRGTIGQNRFGPDPLAPEVLTPPVRTHA